MTPARRNLEADLTNACANYGEAVENLKRGSLSWAESRLDQAESHLADAGHGLAEACPPGAERERFRRLIGQAKHAAEEARALISDSRKLKDEIAALTDWVYVSERAREEAERAAGAPEGPRA